MLNRLRLRRRNKSNRRPRDKRVIRRLAALEPLEPRHLLATNVILGSVDQLTGPADLGLDADNVVYAVNFSNDNDSHDVGGVTFADDTPAPAGTSFVLPRTVTPWGTKPEFGATADDNALEDVLADIRWALSPGEKLQANLDVVAGQDYRLQLLISANRVENRRWDIRVDGQQAVDEITSLGFEGSSYSNSRSVVYTYDFTAPDGQVNIEMGNLFGQNDGGDRNPIWQGLILSRTDFVWDGGGDGFRWTDPMNWDRDSGVPDEGHEIAVFQNTDPGSVDLNGAAITVAEIQFENTSGNNFSLVNGSLSVAEILQTATGDNSVDVPISSLASVTIEAGSLTLSGDINLGVGDLTVAGAGDTAIGGQISGAGNNPPPTYGAFVQSLNPAGYYSFDNVAGANVANDGQAGAVYDGSLTAGATVTTGGGGILGEALSVDDNSNHRLTVGAGGINIDAGGWTAGGWFNDIHPTGDWRTLFRGVTNDHQVIVENTSTRLGNYDNSNGQFRDSGFIVDSVDDGQWHHLIARGNPGGPSSADASTDFFIDGVFVGSTDRRSVTEITAIGNHTGGTQPFAQRVDEVVIFDEVLADDVIEQLASTAPTIFNNLIKRGSGKLTLAGSSLYNGTTEILDGSLVVTADGALGSTAGETVVASGGLLGFSGGVQYTAAEPVTLQGPGTGDTIVNVDGTNSFAGPISAGGTEARIRSDAGELRLDGNINLASATLTFDGPGDTVVNGNILLSTPSNLNGLAGLGPGDHTITVAGQTFMAHVDDDGIDTWLLIGRGREGWEFDSDGQGNVTDVSQFLGTTAGFAPAAYSDAIVNELIASSGVTLEDVEIRLKRATDPMGSAYQEARWRDFTVATWTWNLSSSTTGNFTTGGFDPVTYEVVSGLAAPFIDVTSNTRDTTQTTGTDSANGFQRVFTWPWSGHGSQRGFSLGDSVTNGANNATSFLWENANEQHAIPYTEVYVRNINARPNNLVKLGTGNVTLAGNNTYDGETRAVEGTLIAASNSALGDSATGTRVLDGATLGLQDISGPVTIAGEALTLDGTGAAGQPGALVNLSGNNSIAASASILAQFESEGEFGVGSIDDAGTAFVDTLNIDADVELRYSKLTVGGDGDTVIRGAIASSLGSPLTELDTEGYWRLGETALPTAADSAGTRDGSYNNFAVGDLGQPGAMSDGDFAAQFDGINNLVTVPHDAPLDALLSGGDYTVSFWMNKDSEAGDWQRLVGKGDATRRTFGVWEEFGAGKHILYQIYTPGGDAQVFSTTETEIGQWYMITVTKQGSDARLYVNGQPDGQFTVPNGGVAHASSEPLSFGKHPNIHTYFPGRLDDISLHDRALTPAEIENLYDARVPLGVADDRLVKEGAGTLTLTADNAYAGGTTVMQGTLLANNTNGSATGPGEVMVENSATLGGDGAISGDVTVAGGGELAPGTAGAGDLATGNVQLEAGSTFSLEFNGPVAGTQHDQLRVVGSGRTVTLNGATLDLNMAYTPTSGDQLVLIDNVDASSTVSGTFAGLPEGATIVFDDVSPPGELRYARITYQGGSGNNDVVLLVGGADLVIDDHETGFSAPGWHVFGTDSLNRPQGFRGNLYYRRGSEPSATATWTFTGLPAGSYQVAATWHAHNNRATDATFKAYDGAVDASVEAQSVFNQQLRPDDFNADGVGWEDVGSVLVTDPGIGGTITVTLNNDIGNASLYAIADAVRIEYVAEPDIEVRDAAGTIVETSVDMGTTLEGGVAEHTVTVKNAGNAPLDLGSISVAGDPEFMVEMGGIDPMLAVGESTTFKIVLDTAEAGNYSGTVSIPSLATNDDPDENPFEFEVSGVINDTLIIDNGGSGFSTTNFTRFGPPLNRAQGYQNDIHYLRGSSASGTATWSFTGLTAGSWEVSATWPEHSNRATDSPFTAYNGGVGGTPSVSLALDQQQRPDDFTQGGTPWKRIGTVEVDAAGVLTVTLNNAITTLSKYVIADAIRIQRTPPAPVASPSIIDNGDPGFSARKFSGLGAGYFGALQGYQDDIHYHAPATQGVAAATWTFDNLDSGDYQVAVTWNEHANRASDASFTVSGTTNDGTAHINQRIAPLSFAGSFTADGGDWAPLNIAGNGGNFTVTGSSLTVTLATSVTGYVIADAVRVVPLAALRANTAGVDTAENFATAPLTLQDVDAVFDAAVGQWSAVDPAAAERLAGVTVQVADLPGDVLGLASEELSRIWLDSTAAGNGWDVSGGQNAESGEPDMGPVSLRRFSGSLPSALRSPLSIDLLTVLTHEMGHLLGLSDLDPIEHPHEVMSARLSSGVRRLPSGPEPTITVGVAPQDIAGTSDRRDEESADQVFAELMNDLLFETSRF